MKRRFSKKEEASAARRQLQYIRQLDGETIEEYAERVHFLTMDGYYRSKNDIIDQIGTEAFLRGCQEKEAARIVIEKNPRTINEALKWIKSSLANQKAIYGARKSYSGRPQSYSQRQVTFSDMNDSDHSPQRPTALQHSQRIEKVDNSLQTDIKDLVSLVGQLLKDGRSNRSSSPEMHREYYNSPSKRPQSNYGRSPTPPRSQSKFRSPQNSRSPSPHRGSRSSKEQDNMPFRRAISLLSEDLVLELIKRPDFKPDRVRPLGSRLTQEEESLNELVVRRTVGRSLVIPAAVNSIPVKATIDTAAYDYFRIGPQPVIGKLVTNTAISIGQATMHWDVCVIDMTDTIILGLDFLNACSAVVDLVHMSVVLNGESIPAQLVGGNCQSLSEVLLSRSVKVPPNSSMLITVEVKSPPEDHYVIVPKRNHLPVLISNVMGTGPKCIVNIVNDTGLHVKIKKGSCLGYAEPVDEIIDNNSFVKDTYNINQVYLSLANSYDQEDKPSDMPLPGHLQDLYDCSTTNLKDDQMSTLRAHTQWSRFLNDVDDVIPLAKRQVSPLEVKIAIVEENQTTKSEESFNSSIQGLKASSFSVADSNEHDMTEPNIEGDAIYTNWMQNYSPHHLRQLQLQDSDLFPLIEWIESQYDPSDAELRLQSPATRALWLLGSCLEVIDGVLYYKWINQSERKPCLVVPNSLKSDVLLHCHDSKVAGHLGQQKTLDRHLAKSLNEVHKLARENLRTTQHRQKRDYDLRLAQNQYHTGDLVYKIDSSTKIGHSKKLGSPWIGPYLVVSDHFPLYTIKDRKGESVIHHDRLKRCNDREIPLWLRRMRHNLFYDTSFVHADESTGEDPLTDPDKTLYSGGQLLQNLDLVSDVSLNDEFQQLFIDQEDPDDEAPQGLLASSTNDDFLVSEVAGHSPDVQGTRSPITSHEYPCTRRGRTVKPPARYTDFQ
ncbi:unnamed protein product [Mytilus coruscus]|uniref:Integrase zinc-binding domain-containing protein n=1 Tax=Mytilus coruscus TaxID=42192 RepID=A0A6J8AFV7_MYTCO|nr:unnamed protein product [Mytilus coruscus]